MAETTAASANEVKIEDIGPSRKKVTITIPGERVSEQVELSLEGVAGSAEFPGFRKGHVPRKVVEKRFGKLIRDEAKNQLISSAYSEAVEANELRVLGEPDVGDELESLEVEAGTPITFSVEVEVAPDFELPELEGIEVTKPKADVADEMVDSQIAQMQQNEGELEQQSSSGPGDFCIGKGVIVDSDDKELLTLDGAVIQIPGEGESSGSILGVYVEDFSAQIGSPGQGDTLTVKAVGPEGHENPEIRGKDLTITFEVQQVQRIIPAKVEDLVAKYGLSDEAQFRETVTLQLNQRAVVEQQAAMREQIAEHLIDTVKMDLPEALTQSQIERNVERQRMEMMYRGVDPGRMEQRMAEIRATSQETAKRELKLFFILAKVAEKLEVNVSEQEVRGRVAQIAAERNVRPQDMIDELQKQNQLPHVVQQIREHKAMDAILSKAKVTDEA